LYSNFIDAFCLHFGAVHKLTGKPNSLYDAADGDEDSKFLPTVM